jgi:hypothetical protein
MDKETIKDGILFLLEGDNYTLLEIRSFFKLNKIEGYFEEEKESWRNLKNLLNDMEDQELIEERHFDDGRVDYSIEQRGIDLIKQKRNKLKSKWNIN